MMQGRRRGLAGGQEDPPPCQIARRYENASRNRPHVGQNNNISHTGRVPWEREEFMPKIRRREVYKSRTKSINNIYLGGPNGPDEEELEALKSLASRSDEGGGSNKIQLTVYLMEKDYLKKSDAGRADGTGTDSLPALPTAPEDTNKAGEYFFRNKVDVTEGTSLFDSLDLFVAESGTDNLWSAIEANSPYLNAFYRGADKKYGSTGAYFDENNEQVTGDLTVGATYTWKGWGVMYNPGKGAPSTANTFTGTGKFDPKTMFTDKTMVEQTVRVKPAGTDSDADDQGKGYDLYTFIYAQTEYTFTYYDESVHLVLRDAVEEVEEMTEEALLKAKEAFDNVEHGYAELIELLEESK